MDVLAAGTPIAGRCELERSATWLQIHYLLDGSFAVRTLAENHRAVMVLQTRCQNLGGAGCQLVYEYDDGKIGELAAAAGLIGAADAPAAPPRGDDYARVDQHIANIDGRIEISARIVSKIEHQSSHVIFRKLL